MRDTTNNWMSRRTAHRFEHVTTVFWQIIHFKLLRTKA